LTEQRFLLLQEGVRQAVTRKLGEDAIAGEWRDMSKFPGCTKTERAFVILAGS